MAKNKKRKTAKLNALELTLRDVIELLADGLRIETCRFGYISEKKHAAYYNTEENEILINTRISKEEKEKPLFMIYIMPYANRKE